MPSIKLTEEQMTPTIELDPFWNDENAQRYHDEFIRHQETENKLIVFATALALSVTGLFISIVAILSR